MHRAEWLGSLQGCAADGIRAHGTVVGQSPGIHPATSQAQMVGDLYLKRMRVFCTVGEKRSV